MRSILAILARRRAVRAYPREGWQGHTDRARRVGIWPPPGHASSPRSPPTPPPCRGFRGPLRWDLGLPRAAAGWVRTPVLPTRYTHPATHPVYPPCLHRLPATLLLHLPHVLYSQFGHLVGEPRGLRTHQYSGSQDGYIQFMRFRRVYTAV